MRTNPAALDPRANSSQPKDGTRPGKLDSAAPRSTRRSARSRLLLALLLVLLVVSGCQQDPLERVSELLAAGETKEAIELLQALVDRDPDNPDLQYAYGWALSRSGRPDRAQWPLREALKSPDHRIAAARLMGTGALRVHDWDGVFEAADIVLEDDPDDVPALLLKARAQVLSRTHYEQALANADRILEVEPDNVAVLPIRTAALLGLDRLDEVQEALATLDSRVRDVAFGEEEAAHACATQGTFAAERGELDEARRLFEECIAEFPASQVLVISGVEFFESVGDFDRAIELLKRYVDESPGVVGPKLALASRLAARGRRDEAEALLRLGTESEDPYEQRDAWLELSKHFQREQEWEKAADAVEQAVEVAPEVSESLLLALADSSTLAQRYDRAREIAQRLESPAYRNVILGRLAVEAREYQAALDHFDAGLKLWPDNPVAHYYAARAAEGINDWDRAVEEYRWAIRSGVATTDARVRLAMLYDALGKPMAAWEALRAELRDAPADRELSLVACDLAGRTGQLHAPGMKHMLAGLRTPEDLAEGAARVANGLVRAQDTKSALSYLSETGLDYRQPVFAPALRASVLIRAAGGDAKGAKTTLQRALVAAPDAAAFHTIKAELLKLENAPVAEQRAALEHALELNPDHVPALVELGEIEMAAGETEAALAHFERAMANDEENVAAKRGAARAANASGAHERAEDLLTEVLYRLPFDVEAARLLVTQQLERGAADATTRLVAERLVSFAGSEESSALLDRVEAAVGTKPRSGA